MHRTSPLALAECRVARSISDRISRSPDQTLYQRADTIEAGWQIVQPILDLWSGEPPLAFYEAGSAGPGDADELIASEGRTWRAL